MNSVVAGPLARSAEDLRLEIEIIGGPEYGDAIAYQWRLPKPRNASLKEYRLGYVVDDSFCRVTPEVLDVLNEAFVILRRAGVQLVQGWPKGVKPAEQWETYYRLSATSASPFETEETLGPLRKIAKSPWARAAKLWLDGNAMSHKAWLAESGKRLKARQIWQDYFREFDAFLMPELECFVPAFPHDHTKTFDERTLDTSLGPRPYGDLLKWVSIATLTGCPATVAPVGRTKQGLPVGIQIMGPYLEDATSIDIAGSTADVLGGFQPPPDFPA